MELEKISKSGSSASVGLQASMDRRNGTDIAKKKSESTETRDISLFDSLLGNLEPSYKSQSNRWMAKDV
ncbi:MAG: hypothetical protein JSW39_19790 [Desulfobacterales bacterium]|nr:MAG: hypothetical protein JSW39_19790 [Desulfobacterales bacterium]